MRKFILGISLFFGGIIGFSSWIISSAIINNGMSGIGLVRSLKINDLLGLGVFAVMGLVGLFISLSDILFINKSKN